MEKIRLLFLDLNGTLVDDWGASHAGACACMRHFGIREPTLTEYILGVSGDGDYKKYYADLGITADRDALYEIFLPAYRTHTRCFTTVQVFPGVHETLEALQERGVEVHILTAARADLAERLIDTVGIRGYCSNFHYHIHNKEAQIHAVLDGMDIERTACAMMGDVPSDVVHAKRAGILGVGFANPDVPRSLFTGINMDCMALHFGALLDLC